MPLRRHQNTRRRQLSRVVQNLSNPTAGPIIGSCSVTVFGTAGSEAFTLTGSGFTGVTSVLFGTAAATSLVVVSDTSITAVSPAHAAGSVDVWAQHPTLGAGRLVGVVSFGVAPTVSAITPSTGATAGGTAITNLAGTGFVSGATAKIGGVACTDVTFVSSTRLTCVTPAGTAGAKNVVVTNPNTQTSGTSGNGLFTYAAPFDPTSLTATTYLRGPYTSPLPLAGVASAGASGNAQESKINNNPDTGTALDGVTPLRYDDGATKNGKTTLVSGGTAVDISDVIDLDHYTVWGLVYLESAAAMGAQPYLMETLLSGDARFGVMFSADGIGAYHYDGLGGVFPHVSAACSTGAWHFFCIRYTSAGGGVVQIDIDNVAGTPTQLNAIAVLAGVETHTAHNGFAVNHDTFRLMERMTLKSVISDATRDNVYAYLKATYPSAGLP